MIEYDYDDPPGRMEKIVIQSGSSGHRAQLHAWQAFYEVLAEVAQRHYCLHVREHNGEHAYPDYRRYLYAVTRELVAAMEAENYARIHEIARDFDDDEDDEREGDDAADAPTPLA